jgi:hypothetical protein
MLPFITEEVARFLKEGPKPKAVPSQSAPSQVVHFNVICDNCQQENITGVRYRCTECPDFDLCEKCEATVEHPHCFYKMKQPQAVPVQEVKIDLPMDSIAHFMGMAKNWLKGARPHQPAPQQPQQHKPMDEIMKQLLEMGFDKEYLSIKLPYMEGKSLEEIIDSIQKDI